MANTSIQKIKFKGQPTPVTGRELKKGDKLPSFKLTANDLSDLTSDQYKGKTLILSVVPSIDTPTCQLQTKRFNKEAAALGKDVEILTVSMDLPFAQKRWCGTEGIDRVKTASDYKYRAFGEDFGVFWQGPALLARAVFVVDGQANIRHVEYVEEISAEPDYAAALDALKSIK